MKKTFANETNVKIQTPMQQLIKEVKSQYDESTNVSVRNELGRIYWAIKDVYLKKEKDLMIDFSFKYGELTMREMSDSFEKEYKTNEK